MFGTSINFLKDVKGTMGIDNPLFRCKEGE